MANDVHMALLNSIMSDTNSYDVEAEVEKALKDIDERLGAEKKEQVFYQTLFDCADPEIPFGFLILKPDKYGYIHCPTRKQLEKAQRAADNAKWGVDVVWE